MLIRPALICYALAATLLFSTCAQAAPAGETTTTAEGLVTTLEINQFGADLANTIRTDLAAIDVENAQPYASTEVDTEAELAPTSLPMTIEEMALAEVAAVVAELTTTTADEIKAKELATQELEGFEVLIRRREEAAKQQTIEPESANAFEGLEDVTANGKDRVVATTFRGSFADVIETTMAPQTTTAWPTTTESPAILNELVKAAVAANEILAAALNAASMAVTHTNATTAAVVNGAAATTTIAKPEAAMNTEAAAGDGQVAVIGSETLPEATASWQPVKIETTSVVATTTTLNSGTAENGAIPTTTIPAEIMQSETTPNANIANEIESDNLLAKSLASEQLGMSVTSRQQTTATGIQVIAYDSTTVDTPATASGTEASKLDGSLEIQTSTTPGPSMDSEVLLEQFKGTSGQEEAKPTLKPLDNESAESKKVILIAQDVAEPTETTLASGGNEMESEITSARSADATLAEPRENVKAATLSENKLEIRPINDEGTQIAASNDQDAVRSTNPPSEEPPVENTIPAGRFEIAKVTEVKPELLNGESERERSVESEVTTATTKSDELPETTTEPLETLIAVESEARAPNKIIPQAEEVGTDAAVVTTIPEITTTTETTAAAAAARPTVGENVAEPTTNLAVAVTAPASEEPIITTTALEVDMSQIRDIKTELETTTDTTNEVTVPLRETEQDAKTTQQTTTANTTESGSTTAGDAVGDLSTTTEMAKGTATTAEAISNGEERTRAETTTAQPVEQAREATDFTNTESALSSTSVPLAAFTTTPAVSEPHLHSEPAVSVSTANEQDTESGTETTTHAVDTITTTLRSSTTTIVAAGADTTTTTALENESIVSDMPATTTGATLTTTDKTEAEVRVPTQREAVTQTTTEVVFEEQPLYMRTLSAQQHATSDNKIETTTSMETETSTITKAAAKTAAEERTTAGAITTSEPTEAANTAIASTTTVTGTTTTPAPETTTTTTESTTTTTTTTTTTLSPMGLIIAEHEARSLESSPPRVSRIISDDGIEVLSGYSIVHHMHAAALAALAAKEA